MGEVNFVSLSIGFSCSRVHCVSDSQGTTEARV